MRVLINVILVFAGVSVGHGLAWWCFDNLPYYWLDMPIGAALGAFIISYLKR